MKSSLHDPNGLGYSLATMLRTTGCQGANSDKSSKSQSSLNCSLSGEHESGIESNRGTAHRGEYANGSSTHRPSRHGSGISSKRIGPNRILLV